MVSETLKRCSWVTNNDLYIQYHDKEWGIPLYDENHLFELFILESMQAGLNWFTILSKRENYRRAFDRFDPHRMASYDEKKYQELMNNKGIIRNSLKIQAAITNAKVFLKKKEQYGNFSHYLWQFVDGKPIKNHWQRKEQVPSRTPLSDQMAKQLKQDGFRFVGSITCYAFMQASGMVNDHTTDCFCYKH